MDIRIPFLNAFKLRITGNITSGTHTETADMTVVRNLIVNFVRRGRIFQAHGIDVEGRIVILNLGTLPSGTYGVELVGYYNGEPWRFFKKDVFEIVRQNSDATPAGSGDVPTYDVSFELNFGGESVSAEYVDAAIAAHDADEQAHPDLREEIANAGKVNDVQVDGQSILDPETKVANIDSSQFGKVDDVEVNGQSVLDPLTKKVSLTIPMSASAEITENDPTAEPEANAVIEDGEIKITLKNVKGEKGDPLTWSDLTEIQKAQLKGRDGDSAVYNPDDPSAPDFVMASHLGASNVKSITQKGITDAMAGYVKMSFSSSDLNDGNMNNKTVGEEIGYSTVQHYHNGLFRVQPGRHGVINTVAGINTSRAYCFVDEAYKVLWVSGNDSASRLEESFVVPNGAAYIGVNYKDDEGVEFSLIIGGIEEPINGINDAISELQDTKSDVEDIKQLLSPEETTYTIDDLESGNINNYTLGTELKTGALANYKHIVVRCEEGQTITITTLGGQNQSVGYGFANKNNIIIKNSGRGAINNAVVAVPAGAAVCAINCMEEGYLTFSLKVSPKPSWMSELREEVSSLREDVDSIVNPSTDGDIPLYHGKDMFFIKDIPLDFYAQNVLFKNFPKYDGVYVNCAQDLSRRNTNDFSVPVINHVNPTGKVYFKDGDIVDIYSDDGKLYKDSWNAVTGITAHNTDLATKQKNIKVMFLGSSTTEYGLATYVKNYLSTMGVTMQAVAHMNDALGTPSEGYAGWSCEMICGKKQGSGTYPQTGVPTGKTNPFMKLATSEDKEEYPDYCFTYVEGSTGERTSYANASDKTQDFYIFDFAWYLQTRSVQTPDVVFFILGLNGTVENYGTYMPWIVERIMQACPNCKIGINLSQAIRLQSDANAEVEEMCQKLNILYDYIAQSSADNLKVVSCHCYQSPYFAHKFASEDGENAMTSKVTMDMTSSGGYLHMRNSGYQQIAKAIGAYIAYCLPDAE